MIKIATFNANSLRSRLPIILKWMKENCPDILCVQETKVQDVDFPADAFAETGYNSVFKGQKSYNGVAIFSRSEIAEAEFGLDSEPSDAARMIKAKIYDITIINTYIPQGHSPESEKFTYKLKWFERLGKYFDNRFNPTEPVIWLGDFNIAPDDRDVHDPIGLAGHVCFHPDVQKALKKIMDWGFIDVFRTHCDEPGQYTFWDYRVPNGVKRNIGWRIDHIMATKPLARRCSACYIDKEPRLAEKPSDHTFLIAEFH